MEAPEDFIETAQNFMGDAFWYDYPTTPVPSSFHENTFRQGERSILRRMNMLNRLISERGLVRTLHGRIGNRIFPETGERIEYEIENAPGFWNMYEETKQKFEARKEDGIAAGALAYLLPVGIQIRTAAFEGFPLGLLAWFIMEAARRYHNEDRISLNSLEGLYISGMFYLFDAESRVKYGEPQQINETEWITRAQQTISAYSTHIYYFPLKTVVPVIPPTADSEFSFDRYFKAVFGGGVGGGINSDLVNTVMEGEMPTGSDMNLYVVHDSLYIAKLHPNMPTSIAVQNNTRRVRTAGLANVLTEPYLYKGAISRNLDSCWGNLGSELYIPSGESNCFLSCVEYALIENEVAEMWSTRDFDFISETSISDFQNQAEQKVMRNYIDPVLKRISNLQKNNGSAFSRRLAKKELACGFSAKKLVKFYKEFVYLGVDIQLYYEREENRLRNRFEGKMKSQEEKEALAKASLKICLFQLNDCGEILSKRQDGETMVEEGRKKYFSHLSHCCVITPSMGNISRTLSKVLIPEINIIAPPFFQRMRDRISLKFEPTVGDIEKLVEYQTTRHNNNYTNTLIFQENHKIVEGEMRSTPDRSKPTGRRAVESNVVVFAYDLETVENTFEIQDLVYEPFRKAIPAERLELYRNHSEISPVANQIPYSAQWVPVNLSDCERHAARKTNLGKTEFINHLSVTCDSTETPLPSYPNETLSDYILDSPFCDFGHCVLGACVESSLQDMANYTFLSQKSKKAYVFCHNGAGFDNYVILQFSRFKVNRILKTPRGILSFSISVPVRIPESPETESISLIFRDTRLHVNGSLKMLCDGFKVPKEWKKIDFPIEMINSTTCYHPQIMTLVTPYAINDVLCLAYIMKKINVLIGNSQWEPAQIDTKTPPICQFVTCMSMVRAATRNHFEEEKRGPNQNIIQIPAAIDLPVLRQYINQALIGGRVCAFAKSYSTPFAGEIFYNYLKENRDNLKYLYTQLEERKACKVVEDVTSLYPTAQAFNPMPLGPIRFLTLAECKEHIDLMHCVMCDRLLTLCPAHKYSIHSPPETLRPFSIIIVKNLNPTETAKQKLRNLIPRKLANNKGLVYSLETLDEIRTRLKDPNAIASVASMSNVDLYWARRAGFTFEILSGFTFQVGMAYNSFIEPAFQKRIEAKLAGDKLLSDFLKLTYNGSFGVTAQQDIDESNAIITLPVELHELNVNSPNVRGFILKERSGTLNADEFLTGESLLLPSGQTYMKKKKFPHTYETFSNQSPNQIGVAILSYARHHMNLMMFNIETTHQNYTDTDSVDLGRTDLDLIDQRNPLLLNSRSDAPLGTLKNDHADNNGTEPRVFFSLFGTKKVKMHFTINQEGEIKIYNTFKGFNPSTFIRGRKLFKDHAEYVVSKCLLEIGRYGFCNSAQDVTSWKKTLGVGVTIADHKQTMPSETYLSHSQGTKIVDNVHGRTEYFIPHGSTITPDYLFKKDLSTKKSYFIEPKREEHLPAIWNVDEYFEEYPETSILDKVIEKYYDYCANKEYTNNSEEYHQILSTFHAVNSALSF